MDDSTDSFACSNDANDFGSPAFTSDTNDSTCANDTNAYCNPAFTSDNDNCFVDNSTIHTQNDLDNAHHNTHSSSYPSETNDTNCIVEHGNYKTHINESDENHRQDIVSQNKDDLNECANYSKENNFKGMNTLKTNEDCYHEDIRHKTHNDKYDNNICAENPKDNENKEICLSKQEPDSGQKETTNNLNIDHHNTKYESPSYGLMKILNQETDTKTILEYNNNEHLKDNQFNLNNFDTSKTSLAIDPKQNEKFERFAPHWKQFLAAMGPYLMIFSGGLSCGFSATLLPQLKQEQSVILVNQSSPSWIASMAALPMAPGCFIGGWIIEKWGRRYALRVLSLPFFLGWILIATAPNLSLMLMGRFLNGISIGMLAPPMSLFISETSHPKLRGMFLAFLSFSLAIGIFVAHLIGTWVSWSLTAAICSIFPLISAGLLTFVPESPMWLLSKGRNEEATKSFYWLRGHNEEVTKEFTGIMDRLRTAETSPATWKEKLKTFYSPEFFKPLVIMIIIYVTCQFSGVHVITFYSVTIIEMAVGKGINKYGAMLTIDFLRTVTTLLTIMTSRKFSRRLLCMVSGTLTAISMMSLAIFLYFYKEIPESLTAVPLCFLSAFIIAINIGLMPLPWIIVGEIFPSRVRSFGAGLASAIGYSSTFIVVKTAPGMMVDIGQVATFMFYGSVALVGTAILYFILPETKGRSMVEIEALFKRNKVKNNP
ncbi:facilitated trehalose transporter Tret1-like [Aricia agestis]|uniref:facilitated trehalose transporter Tret1-like n=1 Tax=Aricia agestis TaxID=91739 RepID=UPI001C20957A|nr:facilitated trehalose transporter Tret1-like [Aricia agestis]XP_041983516.1 facilitated trehalose transporter Tret1-like [Aricia agestis]XP_041983517.1 facilitated trehalose transporter Tret1-like [Aricia agestis]